MVRSSLAIVIPGFNEEKTIASIVNSVKELGRPIVVNDGSSDRTSIEAELAGALVVNHLQNLGYDAALNSGFDIAIKKGFEYIVTFDADGQHSSELISQFYDLLHAGNHLVLGVRDSKARLGEKIFGWYTQTRFGIKDPLCGMKGYSVELCKRFGEFDTYGSIGTQLMLRAVSANYQFKQVPFTVRKRDDLPRFGRRLSANYKILRALAVWLRYKNHAS